MGEIENIGVADGLHDIRHRRVVAASRIALVLAQRLHEVVLALAAKRGTFCSPEKSWLWQKLHRCCWISARARSSRPGSAGSAAGTGGGSCAITFAMPRKSSSLRSFIIAFIGSTTRIPSRNIYSWIVT